MPLFQLDPRSIAARVHAAPDSSPPPTLSKSTARGAIGFTLLSIAGFAPWPLLDLWMRRGSEMQLYLFCTAIFIGLSGPLLHRLIIGPGSLARFYKVFALAFLSYAVAWVAFWVWLRGREGELTGLLAGTAAMGAILAVAFDAPRAAWKIIAALFLLSALGYFTGGWLHGKLAMHHRVLAMMLWAVCYGLGSGAGLGVAFYLCQSRARLAIADRNDPSTKSD